MESRLLNDCKGDTVKRTFKGRDRKTWAAEFEGGREPLATKVSPWQKQGN